ncbi:MAG: hypothetical protein JWM04_2622 [Verrucomicrobiales bacterium]|jgi:competence protein ComGC|nr:hypothetical protein [Verrucomicrobiales bacterium]
MKHRDAFTLLEVVICLGSLLVVGLLLLPGLGRTHVRSSRVSCVSNLKQIGVAFRLFANDHDGKYPAQLSRTNDGLLEISDSASAADYFSILQSELASQKILVCPTDTRTASASWETLKGTNISYALFLESSETEPSSLMLADRNMVVAEKQTAGVTRLVNPERAYWGPDMHVRAGNLAFGDGSARQTDNALLRKALVVMSQLDNPPTQTAASAESSTNNSIARPTGMQNATNSTGGPVKRVLYP